MGVINPATAPKDGVVGAGAQQDAILRGVTDELQDKGYVVAQMDKLVNWARSGSLWPMTFGHLISAQVAAFRLTRSPRYLAEAMRYASMAVDLYWQDSPLPRASLKTDHYETITGADSLALALLELHVARTGRKTIVPANTIDR